MANLYDTPYFKDYNIVNQANVERGINALQANQGIVNTLTGLPIGPASGRAYLRNLSGSEEPITEDFFNADQLAEIKNRTASSMAEASMDPSSFDALNKRVLYDLEKPISMSGIFSNPATDIDATLGMYTYKQNPDGTISAIDTHDFDSIEGGGQQFYDQKKKGVGTPSDILGAVKRGIDMFDCVLPTRSGRTGLAFTWNGKINIRNSKFKNDNAPLDDEVTLCGLNKYSKNYLNHLFNTNEILGSMLLTMHNINFYQQLMKQIRETIINGTFDDFHDKYINTI